MEQQTNNQQNIQEMTEEQKAEGTVAIVKIIIGVSLIIWTLM